MSKYLQNLRFPFRQQIWDWLNKPGDTIKTKLHGLNAFIPAGYMYPVICRNHPAFNNPFLQLCWQTFQNKKQPIIIVDIGAAIGDTLCLIKQNLPVNSTFIYCIEPDPFLADYLTENSKPFFKETKIVTTALSSQKEMIPGWKHPLNISGKHEKILATRFDELWHSEINEPIDVIKIDVEGMDGKVLAGAKETIKQFNPSIIFEFHPLLIDKNDLYLPFETLVSCGYEQLIWFDKFGKIIMQSEATNRTLINAMIQKSMEGGKEKDIHYDIIAPAKSLNKELNELADCNYAKTKPYPY